MANAAKKPHKAKPRSADKINRNYVGRSDRNLTKYVARMLQRGTFCYRKSRSKRNDYSKYATRGTE